MAVNSVSLENIENHHYYFGIWSSGDSPKNAKPPLPTARIYSGDSLKTPNHHYPQHNFIVVIRQKTSNRHYPRHESIVVIHQKRQTTTTRGTERSALPH